MLTGRRTFDVAQGWGGNRLGTLAGTPAALDNPTVIVDVGVTHLRYPVHKA